MSRPVSPEEFKAFALIGKWLDDEIKGGAQRAADERLAEYEAQNARILAAHYGPSSAKSNRIPRGEGPDETTRPRVLPRGPEPVKPVIGRRQIPSQE